jgi:hypothetical protein
MAKPEFACVQDIRLESLSSRRVQAFPASSKIHQGSPAGPATRMPGEDSKRHELAMNGMAMSRST